MKKSIIIIAAMVLASFTILSGACVENYRYVEPGDLVKQQRDISYFDAVEIGGAFEVTLVQGSGTALTVEAGENIIDQIITEVRGKTLVVTTEKGCCKNAGKMALYITFEDLKRMDISGACELSNEGTLALDVLAMELSGASELKMNMDLDKLDIELSGASEIDFTGSCDNVYIDASGASEIDALGFQVDRMTIDASGASECRVYVTDELTVDASGATSVRYKGDPTVSASKSGASSIKPY